MAKPRTPHHGDSSRPEESGGPPRRSSPGGDRSVSAAQESVAETARRGRQAGGGGTLNPGAGLVQGPAAKIPLKPPNSRHNLDRIRPGNPAKDRNTVVLPGTDVGTDLADISAGRGTWIPESNRYEVNGRTYAVEPTGTVFPVSGPGFVNLSRSEYKVMKQLIGSDGNIDAAWGALRRDPSVNAADWRSALQVFQHHKNYRGGA